MIGSLDFGALRAAYASGNVTPEVVIREVYRRINARGVCPVWISLVPENEALARARLAPRGSLTVCHLRSKTISMRRACRQHARARNFLMFRRDRQPLSNGLRRKARS